MVSYRMHLADSWAPSTSIPTFSGALRLLVDANAGVTTGGGNATAVVDQSGVGATVTITGTVPFTATGLNGHPAFDMQALGALSGPVTLPTNDWTVFMVGTVRALSDDHAGILCFAPSGDDYNIAGGFAIWRYGVTSEIEFRVLGGSVGITSGLTDGTIIRLVAVYKHDVPNQEASLYINNVASFSLTDGLDRAFAETATLVVGGRYQSGAPSVNWLHGQVAAAGMYNVALDATQRAALDTALQAKVA